MIVVDFFVDTDPLRSAMIRSRFENCQFSSFNNDVGVFCFNSSLIQHSPEVHSHYKYANNILYFLFNWTGLFLLAGLHLPSWRFWGYFTLQGQCVRWFIVKFGKADQTNLCCAKLYVSRSKCGDFCFLKTPELQNWLSFSPYVGDFLMLLKFIGFVQVSCFYNCLKFGAFGFILSAS